MTDRGESPGSKRRQRLVLLVLLPVLLVLGGGTVYLNGGRHVETDNAYVKTDILAVSSEVSGLLSEVLVRANQEVGSGDLLMRLDQRLFHVAVEQARARLGQVETELQALHSGYREKLAQIELARSNLAFAQRELDRQHSLKGRDFVSASALDDLAHAAELRQRELDVATLDLQRLGAALGGADRPIEQHPSYLAALAELEYATLNLERTDIRAPRAGIINRAPLAGQYVQAGQMITALVATEGLWVEANFTETELTHMAPGQAVLVRIDSYPQHRWTGVVESISPATGAEFSIIPAQNATGNWVKVPQRVAVRVRLDEMSQGPLLRAGLSARVRVDTGHRRRIGAYF